MTSRLSPPYNLYDTDRGGGLWVGRRYAAGGETHPDPVKGLTHAANATQVCRFYYLLATGRLINPERSAQMLRILSNPNLDHKFVYTLRRTAPGTLAYRKSGTWRSWHSDSILVWGNRWRCYILVALVEDPDGEQILRELVTAVEGILLDD